MFRPGVIQWRSGQAHEAIINGELPIDPCGTGESRAAGAPAKLDEGSRTARPTDASDDAGGQEPIAVVLACSDDPVPCAAVFDQSAEALVVVRTLGHELDGVLSFIEYAVDVSKAPLVVVLGHEGCAALRASDPRRATTATQGHTVKNVEQNGLASAGDATAAPEAMHVGTVCQLLVERSPWLKQQTDDGNCAVVGAVRLCTGRVELCCSIGDVGETV